MTNLKGFTLVEILAAMFIGLFLLGAIYVSVDSGQRSSVALESKITAHQDTRAVLEVMATEISMASYSSYFNPDMWRDPGNCMAAGTGANKGIQAAAENSISVEMDTDNSGVVGDNSNEVITYIYDTANQRITRRTNCAAVPDSFLGDVNTNPSRSERVVNSTLNPPIPLFTYFDGLGNPIPAGNLPASIPNIRRIQITLAVDTENVDPNTHQPRRMIYTTSLVPKNHATCQ